MNEARKGQLRLFLRLLLIVTLCFIWGNSLLSREESSELSGGIVNWLRSIGIPVQDDHFVRKLAHFAEYCLLGCELSMLLRLSGRRGLQNLCFSALAAFFVAAADETIQIFSGRGPMLTDVLLDFCGAVTGILVGTLLVNRAARKHGWQGL